MHLRRGPLQTISIDTVPKDATVTIRPAPEDGSDRKHISLRRKPAETVNSDDPRFKNAAYIVTASSPGYGDRSVAIESGIPSETWVRNLIWLHPFLVGGGILVDVSTGAGYELRPSNILIELEPTAATSED